MTCTSERDAHGTSFRVPAAPTQVTPHGRHLAGLPAIDVWWSRNFKVMSEETLVIRQEYADRQTADCVEMTLGQVYDLIDALNKAVENA